jgi:hypothetical protein
LAEDQYDYKNQIEDNQDDESGSLNAVQFLPVESTPETRHVSGRIGKNEIPLTILHILPPALEFIISLHCLDSSSDCVGAPGSRPCCGR